MNDKTYVRNVAVTALNIFDGMEVHTNWDKLQPVWEEAGMGFIEVCVWLSDFAVESEDMLRKRFPQDFPGVYDYEVSYPLGEQVRLYMMTNNSFPSDKDVSHWLVVLIDAFFSQGDDK